MTHLSKIKRAPILGARKKGKAQKKDPLYSPLLLDVTEGLLSDVTVGLSPGRDRREQQSTAGAEYLLRGKTSSGPNMSTHIFFGEAFFLLHKCGAFFSSLVLAHQRCAHSFSASQLGELVLIED